MNEINNIIDKISPEQSTIHPRPTAGVIRYNAGNVMSESSVGHQSSSSPLFTQFSSSMFFKYTPFLWPHNPMSQFYSFWSYYLSVVRSKCYENIYDLNTTSTLESNLPSNRINLKFDERFSNSHPATGRITCFERENTSKKSTSKNSKRVYPLYHQTSPSSYGLILSSCTQCNFHTRSPTEYQLHCWTTHGKHVCSICGRSFAQKANRDRHMCLHTGARPYPCDMCGEKFSRGDKLKIHKNRNHGGTTR